MRRETHRFWACSKLRNTNSLSEKFDIPAVHNICIVKPYITHPHLLWFSLTKNENRATPKTCKTLSLTPYTVRSFNRFYRMISLSPKVSIKLKCNLSLSQHSSLLSQFHTTIHIHLLWSYTSRCVQLAFSQRRKKWLNQLQKIARKFV